MLKGQESRNELKKHVSSIHCSNALSLIQRKIANALLFHAYDFLLTRDEHQVTVGELCRLVNYQSHDYQRIKQALVELLSTVVEWNIIDDSSAEKDGQWNASSIIADASISGALCTYSYSKRMRELLHSPSVYGCLNMVVQARFKSSYGLALYENCIRYRNLKQTPWFEYGVFRRLMGVDDKKYTVFRDFNRRVLRKAVEEVNDYSNLSIKVELRREKRQVVSLRFLLHVAEETENLSSSVMGERALDEVLESVFSLDQVEIKRLKQAHGEAYLAEKVFLILESTSYKAGKIKNPVGYLTSALREDFKLAAKLKTKSLPSQDDSRGAREDMLTQRAYEEFMEAQIDHVIFMLPEDQKSIIKEQFLASLVEEKKHLVYKRYKKSGLSNRMVSAHFRHFFQANFPEHLLKLEGYEQFKARRAKEQQALKQSVQKVT